MAWTFGAANTNRFGLTTLVSIGASARTSIVCGWWKPTTLTAGLGYWSAGAAIFARIATTTSEIQLSTDNTTDGRWTTSGANIVVDQWYFIAFMLSANNTGPTAAWRVWIGTELNAPVELTVTQNTAPVGNFAGSFTFVAGQVSNTGAVSFIGDISDFQVISQSTFSSGPLSTAAFGAITQDEANRVRNRVVLPIWSGIPFPIEVCAMAQGNGVYDAVYVPMGAGFAGSGISVPAPRMTNAIGNEPSAFPSGAGTLSKGLTGGPREWYANAASQPMMRRR